MQRRSQRLARGRDRARERAVVVRIVVEGVGVRDPAVDLRRDKLALPGGVERVQVFVVLKSVPYILQSHAGKKDRGRHADLGMRSRVDQRAVPVASRIINGYPRVRRRRSGRAAGAEATQLGGPAIARVVIKLAGLIVEVGHPLHRPVRHRRPVDVVVRVGIIARADHAVGAGPARKTSLV